MANFFCGNQTVPGATGNQSITGFGFQPIGVIITIGKNGTGTDSTINYSEGTTDGTRQSVRSIFYKSGGTPKTEKSNTKCVSHYEDVSGTVTEKVAASFVSFDADGITLNFTAVDTDYQMNIKAFA